MEDGSGVPSPTESAVSASNTRDEATERPKKARRTFLTQNACTRCRNKKSKCDGKRPACGRCAKNSAECLYDVAQEGITRMQNLQQLLDKRNDDYDRLMTLFITFQRGSDDQATNLLARLRLGEGLDSLVADIKASQASSLEDVANTPDSQDQQTMHSWPSSPTNQNSWISWSTRCEPGGRSMSFSSDSRLATPRPFTSQRSIDPRMTNREDGHSNDQRRASFQYTDGYVQDRNPYLGSIQWQEPYTREEPEYPDDGQAQPSYHGHSEQVSSGSADVRQIEAPRRSAGQPSPSQKRRQPQEWSRSNKN